MTPLLCLKLLSKHQTYSNLSISPKSSIFLLLELLTSAKVRMPLSPQRRCNSSLMFDKSRRSAQFEGAFVSCTK